MSDEPNPKDLSSGEAADGWAMPEPTFRSSEGYTPGGRKSEAVTGEMEAEGDVKPDEMARAITEEMPGPTSPKSGGSSMLLILGLLALLAAAAIAAYYLLYPTPVDTTF